MLLWDCWKPESLALVCPAQRNVAGHFRKCQIRRMGSIENRFDNIWGEKREMKNPADVSVADANLRGERSAVSHVASEKTFVPVTWSGRVRQSALHMHPWQLGGAIEAFICSRIFGLLK